MWCSLVALPRCGYKPWWVVVLAVVVVGGGGGGGLHKVLVVVVVGGVRWWWWWWWFVCLAHKDRMTLCVCFGHCVLVTRRW